MNWEDWEVTDFEIFYHQFHFINNKMELVVKNLKIGNYPLPPYNSAQKSNRARAVTLALAFLQTSPK